MSSCALLPLPEHAFVLHARLISFDSDIHPLSMSASSMNLTTKSSGRSSTARGTRIQDVTTMPSVNALRLFDPCAATASKFLYAQGRSIVCCHHDTLSIDRVFSKHADNIHLLSVDNQSEVGGGRLVVSTDAGRTAIVWDLMDGDEVARFVSYETLTTTAWMRNGNVAFGEPTPPRNSL